MWSRENSWLGSSTCYFLRVVPRAISVFKKSLLVSPDKSCLKLLLTVKTRKGSESEENRKGKIRIANVDF